MARRTGDTWLVAALANEYQAKGVAFIAISANDAATYPDDGPEQMKAVAKQNLVEIINCSRETALDCFPRSTIQDAL